MSGTGRMRATEKVMVGFVGTTLQGTAASAGLLELELLSLEREHFVDPFHETFLLCKQEGEESRPDNVPVDSIEERGKHPQVVLAEIDALFLAGI